MPPFGYRPDRKQSRILRILKNRTYTLIFSALGLVLLYFAFSAKGFVSRLHIENELSDKQARVTELERSMHPMLARKFIEFFLKAVRGTSSQLIFTTHESTLLDLELMRRDGIWFAEKDQKGGSIQWQMVQRRKFRRKKTIKAWDRSVDWT